MEDGGSSGENVSRSGTWASKELGTFIDLGAGHTRVCFMIVFYTACMQVTYSFVYIKHFTQERKKGWYVLNSAPFLHPIPILVLDCPRRGQGPSSTVLLCFRVGQRNTGVRASPLHLGPGYSRVRRPGESGARRGRLALLFLPILGIRPGLWPTCCFTQSACTEPLNAYCEHWVLLGGFR